MTDHPATGDRDERFEAELAATTRVRAEAWNGWGKLDDHVLSFLVNPTFMGGPRWPAMRQAYAVARRGDATLFSSDGLADPFDDPRAPRVNGFRMECYAITGDQIRTGTAVELGATWLYEMVSTLAGLVAHYGDVADAVDRHGVLTISLPELSLPDEVRDVFVTEDGSVGGIIGLVDDELPALVEGPLSPIRLVNIKLITRAELEFALAGDAPARRELARRFAAQGAPLRSGIHRPSVV